MKYIAFDTETERISYLNPVPDLICLTYSEGLSMKGSIVTPWEYDIETIVRSWLEDPEIHCIGHNMAFDLSILTFKYPDLLPSIFKALDEDRIHDTMNRETLYNIARHGSIEFIEINGANIRAGYSLSALEKKYLHVDRSELKTDSSAPRTNYEIYKGVPVSEWDDIFIDYAVDDAINTGLVFKHHDQARAALIDERGIDPFTTETFNSRKHFALRLLECVGTRLDPEKVEEVRAKYEEDYKSDKLRLPLLGAGFLVDAIPPQPYKNGALEHNDDCRYNKTSPGYIGKNGKDCGCPTKMKGAVPEKAKTKPKHQYIWNLAGTTGTVEAWPADATVKNLKKEDIYSTVISGKAFKVEVIQGTDIHEALKAAKPKDKAFIENCIAKGHKYFIPDDVTLTTGKEWAETFASEDKLLSIWYERERLKKIVTEYIPKMYYTDEDGNTGPAHTLRAAYGPLVLTGRSHSWASKMYPSRSDQTVDPRVRPCTIPRDGNILVSTDFSSMELGTLAQKCINLFGHSELGNKINKGIDAHAFLGAQIAYQLDSTFKGCFTDSPTTDQIYDIFKLLEDADGEPCESKVFIQIFKDDYFKRKNEKHVGEVFWKDFFKHYRTLAKPVGLGYPGMLGAATLCTVAKATYGLDMTKELAEELKEIWFDTYPEMRQYYEYIKKECLDPWTAPVMVEDDDGNPKKKTYYCYSTPKGMYRGRCGICEAANGTALQAFAAEGALDALYEVQKAVWLSKPGDLLYGVLVLMFIHDEIVYESPEDGRVGERVRAIEEIMVRCMEKATPDVKAAAESAAMRRWSKSAKTIWTEDGNLIPWEDAA